MECDRGSFSTISAVLLSVVSSLPLSFDDQYPRYAQLSVRNIFALQLIKGLLCRFVKHQLITMFFKELFAVPDLRYAFSADNGLIDTFVVPFNLLIQFIAVSNN